MSGEGRVALGIGLAQRVDPVAGFAEVVHQIHDGVEDRELELIQRNWKQKCAQSWVAKRVKRPKQKQHVSELNMVGPETEPVPRQFWCCSSEH